MKALPPPCLIIFRPPISCPLFPSSRVFSSLLFSHSLSGRAICEGPVQHNSAPAETSGSSGYNSEWLSISSERLIRMRNCMSVSSSVPMVPLACGSTSCGPFLCWHSFRMFSGCLCMAGAAQWILVFATESRYLIQFSTCTVGVRNHLVRGCKTEYSCL